MRRVLPALLVFMALAAAAAGDNPIPKPDTGNGLLSLCTANQETDTGRWHFMVCFGYVAGVRQTLEQSAVPPDVDGKLTGLCAVLAVFPIDWATVKKTRGDQLVDVIVKYLKEHPESRHEKSPLLIHLALENAFPLKVADP